MANTWPLTLPPLTRIEQPKEELREGFIASRMDAGPGKRRYNTLADYDTLAFSQLLTLAQVNDLRTFYLTTLRGGSDTFTDTHPITGVSATFRFKKKPTWQNQGGWVWRSQIELEVIG